MIRKIIKIDGSKCNGCGACATACHEGAIEMIDGIATLTREDYCDGLGDCLPACPTGAITFEEREAPDYNEAAVLANKRRLEEEARQASSAAPVAAHLGQWPCQIKLIPPTAPYFNGADLLIAADCTAFAYGNIQEEFIKGKITIIGCPKLDAVDYSEKLSAIIAHNNINTITVLRMEVPCCGGIEYATKVALEASGKNIPLEVVTVSIGGDIV